MAIAVPHCNHAAAYFSSNGVRSMSTVFSSKSSRSSTFDVYQTITDQVLAMLTHHQVAARNDDAGGTTYQFSGRSDREAPASNS